jgi:hypothetical protein
VYCYVDHPRFGRAERYQGQIRIIPDEMKVKYDEKTLRKDGGQYPGTIFIVHMGDLMAEEVPDYFIEEILKHCRWFPENTYVFQTKNPTRFHCRKFRWPEKSIFGTTIETNREDCLSNAPSRFSRMLAMENLQGIPQYGETALTIGPARKFVTIEPVLDFDVGILSDWICRINPEFLNLGADSKNHNLPEPTVEKIQQLVDELKKNGIELREKHNLQRLKKK